MAATMTNNYDWTADEITPEVEAAMAWAEAELAKEMDEAEVDAPLFDEIRAEMTFDEAYEQILALFKDSSIPAHVLEDLLIKKTQCASDARFGYHTLFVEPLIRERLASKEPAWFDAYRTMPDLNEQVMRLVIGRGGAGLKRFGLVHGALFIWYDKSIGAFKVWGYTPQYADTLGRTNAFDITFNLHLAIHEQTDRRHEAALSRLHRATERRRGGSSQRTRVRRAMTYEPTDFPTLLPLPTKGH
jgi:hypothetical protein